MTEGLLSTVAFAKSPAHERFVQNFEGQTKGRYVIAYLAGVGVLGGPRLVDAIKQELGYPLYHPDKMYSGRDVAVICDRAARAGLSLVKLGELIVPARLRANPEMFDGLSIEQSFSVLETASQRDTSYYVNTSWPPPEIEPRRAVLFRPGRPTPCETFVGIIQGLLNTYGVAGSAQETGCLWEGQPFCRFEASW